MKTLTSAAIVALTAAVIGAGGMVTASAQQVPGQPPGPGQFQNAPNGPGQFGQFHRRGGDQFRGQMRDARGGGLRAGGAVNFVCAPRGAERLEIALVRLSYRVELTAEQQALFDAFKTAALTAQTTFSDACAAERPATVADGQQPAPADPVERLRGLVAIGKAHTAALEAVLPAYEAFFNALSDEQKAELQPQRRGNQRGPGRPHTGELDAPALPGTPATDFEPAPAGLIG